MHGIKEAGIEGVRQYLGHKSISSTGVYLKVDDAQASAAVRVRSKRGNNEATSDDGGVYLPNVRASLL